MSDHRKKFSFENLNFKLNKFSSLFDNLVIQNISQFLDTNPEYVNQIDEKTGFTLLVSSVLNGNYDIVQYLLENKSADPNIPDDHGMTPLHYAVQTGNHKIINLLLERGANPNFQTREGETSLHIAADKGDYKVIKLLCLFGANILIRTFINISVYDYAVERGNQKCIEVVKGLIEKQSVENNRGPIEEDPKYNVSYYPDQPIEDVQPGFKTTKNSDSPINRIKENLNIPFYTPDFVYKDLNFQNYTSKNSRINYLNYKGFATNKNIQSENIQRRPDAHDGQYSNLTFENDPNFIPQMPIEGQNEKGLSYYPDYNSAESKRYLEEYDSVNNKKKNYFSDKYSLRESSSFFIQMNDFEQRLEKIKKDLLENVVLTYEKNIDQEGNENIPTEDKELDPQSRDKENVNPNLYKDQNNDRKDENYFSLASPNNDINVSQADDDNHAQNQGHSKEELNNNINTENIHTPYLNTYSSNSKYTSTYSNLGQKLTFNNVDKKSNVNRSDNYIQTIKSENENRTPSHKLEPVNYMTFISNIENNIDNRNFNMPRRLVDKEKSENISLIMRTLDYDRYPSLTSLRQTNRHGEKNFALNPEETNEIVIKPNYTESDNYPQGKNIMYNYNGNDLNADNNINFNDNSENNINDYYYNVPAVRNNMSNNIFSLSNTKTNEYLLSDLELTNEISKIKRLLSENFYDDGRVLTVFYSHKNDINENYVKDKKNEEKILNALPVMKTKNHKNTFGDTTQTTKIIEELFNFNLQEFDEYLKSSLLQEKEEEDEEEPTTTKQSPKEETLAKKIEKKKRTHEMDLKQSMNSLYSQPVNNDLKHYDKFSSVQPLQQNNSVKYLTKTNRSIKDEYKQMSLDTYTIDEVSITICPKSVNETLDKMNMITADIKQNGIDQIEFEYNSTEAMKEIDSFLKGMELEKYTSTFIKHGFDDLSMIVEQMKSETSITDRNLKDIGITSPGHRAKILLKLEEKSNSFEFPLPQSVYHTVEDNYNKLEDLLTDQNIYSIHSWLAGLKMDRYTLNFYNNGYHSIELLFLQMNSKNPLTEKMLEEEIQIKKIGYRIRLLKKLRDDGKEYFNKLKNIYNNKILDQKPGSALDSCKCTIF